MRPGPGTAEPAVGGTGSHSYVAKAFFVICRFVMEVIMPVLDLSVERRSVVFSPWMHGSEWH